MTIYRSFLDARGRVCSALPGRRWTGWEPTTLATMCPRPGTAPLHPGAGRSPAGGMSLTGGRTVPCARLMVSGPIHMWAGVGAAGAERAVQVMRMPSWLIVTVQGSEHRRALLISKRPSYSHSQASSEALESSTGVMVRSAIAVQRSACPAEWASKEPRSVGCRVSVRSSVQHPHRPGWACAMSSWSVTFLVRSRSHHRCPGQGSRPSALGIRSVTFPRTIAVRHRTRCPISRRGGRGATSAGTVTTVPADCPHPPRRVSGPRSTVSGPGPRTGPVSRPRPASRPGSVALRATPVVRDRG
ncbi:hypothetical protein SAMN05442782_8212 [Streptomyces sp. OK228]|nr:hypothetical protein SAMN05442782_8212 [Streptomyces sp. OK228]